MQTARRAALVTREEGYRRALLLIIGILLVLSVGPVFGHHFATGLEHGLRGQDHVGPLCLIAVHEILAPVHDLFHVLIVVGLVYAIYDRVRAALRVSATLSSLNTVEPLAGDPFAVAAAAAGVERGIIRIAEGLPNPAFTAGWFRPRIYVDRAVAERLTRPELSALLAHEGAHAARRDPLRLSLLRFLACTLFWIPALRNLADDVADEVEVQADDHASRGQPLVLASAILKLASGGGSQATVGDAVGFARRTDLLDRRIRRLAGEEPVPTSRVTGRSILYVLLALSLVWISGAVVAHPLPTDEPSHHLVHCEHPRESGLAHLFCFRGAFRTESNLCPHVLASET